MINPKILAQVSIMFETLRVYLFGGEIRWMENKGKKIREIILNWCLVGKGREKKIVVRLERFLPRLIVDASRWFDHPSRRRLRTFLEGNARACKGQSSGVVKKGIALVYDWI